MAIKITAGGKIITKGGLPSCTCCGPCSPNVTTIYMEHVVDPGGSNTVTYITLTGSLNDGTFTGTGPGGTISVSWDTISEEWDVADDTYGTVADYLQTPNRCDPDGVYTEDGTYEVTISFTPLP